MPWWCWYLCSIIVAMIGVTLLDFEGLRFLGGFIVGLALVVAHYSGVQDERRR